MESACDVEWCAARGQRRVGEKKYCKFHANWYQPGGVRAGHFAARGKLEDHKDQHVPIYVLDSGGRGGAGRGARHFCTACRTVHYDDPVYDTACEHCGAQFFEQERVSVEGSSARRCTLCCANGLAAHLPNLPPMPEFLAQLLVPPAATGGRRRRDDRDALAEEFAKEFRTNVRRYNAAMGFVSFADAGGPPPFKERPGRAPYLYVIHGQVHRRVSALLPADGGAPRYGQLYIYDPHEAAAHRARWNEGLREPVLERLHEELLRLGNPFPAAYRSLHEELRRAEAGPAPHSNVVLRFSAGATPDPRRYNTPSMGEIAAVYPSNRPPSKKHLSVYPRGAPGRGTLHDASILHECVDPLTYPLLFPRGELGWCPELTTHPTLTPRERQRDKLDITDFYARRLMTTSSAPALPHAGGRLFQQYVCDAYTKAEAQRLAWVRNNQDKFRTEKLQGLLDFVHGLDSDDAPDVVPEAPDRRDGGHPSRTRPQPGRGGPRAAEYTGTYSVPVPKTVGVPVHLPGSFTGGPRHIQQCYLDAMALVAKFGRPDFFLTMTANPDWPEIKHNLRRGEEASNRPDLVARVFRQKLRALLEDLTQKDVHGRPAAYTYVVEFQKRGLPHAHILLILQPEEKPRTPEDIDRLIAAELPNPDDPDQAELYRAVQRHMLHGPCGADDTDCPCMKDGVCSKGYPKPFAEATLRRDHSYPLYRRRPPAPGAPEHDHPNHSNRWVVPYNPFLLLKYQCHLNVEICTSIKAVKYLYKYSRRP